VALWKRAGIVVVRATKTIRERETTTTRENTIEPFFMHTPTTNLTLCCSLPLSVSIASPPLVSFSVCLSVCAEVMKISPSKERR